VCVLSDGVDSLAAIQASGDLPAVDVLPGQAGSGDEGTAMLEIVHDLAPGAALGFATAFTSLTQFAQNILDLRADGCDILVDDVLYLESPARTAPSAAVNQVTAAGAFTLVGRERGQERRDGGHLGGTSTLGSIRTARLRPQLRGRRTVDPVGSGVSHQLAALDRPVRCIRERYDLYVMDFDLDVKPHQRRTSSDIRITAGRNPFSSSWSSGAPGRAE
jgi:hypothetical protein